MPRARRITAGGIVYHVLNRANGRLPIFETAGDFRSFEKVLRETHDRIPMRTLAFCVMPNHWHLVLWPHHDGDLSKFVHWLTLTHTQRWHNVHGTAGSGHLYQARFKSFPLQSDEHYLTVCRYVERNALRAGLVERAEDWRWGSLCRRLEGAGNPDPILSDGPLPHRSDWVDFVNQPMTSQEEKAVLKCVGRGCPFGRDGWVEDVAKRLGLETTLRSRGRPRKK